MIRIVPNVILSLQILFFMPITWDKELTIKWPHSSKLHCEWDVTILEDMSHPLRHMTTITIITLIAIGCKKDNCRVVVGVEYAGKLATKLKSVSFADIKEIETITRDIPTSRLAMGVEVSTT